MTPRPERSIELVSTSEVIAWIATAIVVPSFNWLSRNMSARVRNWVGTGTCAKTEDRRIQLASPGCASAYENMSKRASGCERVKRPVHSQTSWRSDVFFDVRSERRYEWRFTGTMLRVDFASQMEDARRSVTEFWSFGSKTDLMMMFWEGAGQAATRSGNFRMTLFKKQSLCESPAGFERSSEASGSGRFRKDLISAGDGLRVIALASTAFADIRARESFATVFGTMEQRFSITDRGMSVFFSLNSHSISCRF
jgi:hypothetical protein